MQIKLFQNADYGRFPYCIKLLKIENFVPYEGCMHYCINCIWNAVNIDLHATRAIPHRGKGVLSAKACVLGEKAFSLYWWSLKIQVIVISCDFKWNRVNHECFVLLPMSRVAYNTTLYAWLWNLVTYVYFKSALWQPYDNLHLKIAIFCMFDSWCLYEIARLQKLPEWTLDTHILYRGLQARLY